MLIDLDVVPDREGPARKKTTRPIRYAGLALTVLLLALTGGAVERSHDPGVASVLTLDAQGVLASLLTADTLYTLRGGGATRLEAEPLTPDGPRFSEPTPDGRDLTLAGETLIVSGGDSGRTTFVDARSGQVRWQLGDSGYAKVLGSKVAEWLPERRTVRTWDLATGDALWARPASEYTADETYVVALDERGGASVYATGTGRLVAAVRDLGLPGGSTGTVPAAALVDGRLIAYGENYVAAFRPEGLSRLWLTRGSTPWNLGGCGPGLLCGTDPAAGLTVLDAATGAVRWNGPDWVGLSGAGVAFEQGGRAARVDIATGRVEQEFGSGQPVGELMLYPDQEHTTVRRQRDGRVLGAVPRVTPNACSATGDFLSCQTYDAKLQVWRIPS